MWAKFAPRAILGCILAAGASLDAAQLLDTRILLASTSYIGLGVMDLSEDAVREIGLIEPHGIEVTSVLDGSPAHNAGLSDGDIVLTYRGEKVQGYEHFARLVRETPAGRKVDLGIVRAGERMSLEVEIGRREAEVSVRQAIDEARLRIERAKRNFDDVKIDLNLDLSFPQLRFSRRNKRLGAELEDLGGQLAEHFGLDRGVLVRQVGEGSVADESGLRAGDVIVAVDGNAMRTAIRCERALSLADGVVPVEIIRDRARLTLEIDFGPRPDSGVVRPASDRE